MNLSKYSIIIIIFILVSVIRLPGMEVSVTNVTFVNDGHPFLELYSRIIGNTVQYTSDADTLGTASADIELLVIFRIENDIVMADKYHIKSPQSNNISDFWDLRRYQLSNTTYELELRYVDLNNTEDTLYYSKEINLSYDANAFNHSGILLISELDTSDKTLHFEKSGFYYEPLCFNHINAEENQLIFYTELYNTDKLSAQDCFVKYYIESKDEGNNAISSIGYKKIVKQGFEPLLLNLPLEDYKSGNYELHIEVYDRAKSLLDSYAERFSIFHPLVDLRSNYELDEFFESSFVQLLDENELDYSLKAIYPLVGNNLTETLNFIIANPHIKAKKYFLYSFWNQTAPESRRETYNKYMVVAKAIDIEYANNVGHGFETDRGFYFLKYGRPDDMITVEDEPSAPPYEIWIYNYVPLTQQTNVKFLFYNPSLSGNDFILLHSTCRGEMNNPNWEYELYKDSFDNFNQDNFNKNAKKYFDDF